MQKRCVAGRMSFCSFVRYAASQRLMIICTDVVSLTYLGLHRALISSLRREKKTGVTFR